MSKDLQNLCRDLLRSFVQLLELRNPFNIDHCRLVASYSKKLGEEVGFDETELARLENAAEIHTLGVLLQMEEKAVDRHLPIAALGERTGREVSIHQREEEIFENVVGKVPLLRDCLEVLKQRHEWYDGSGSILGLSGDGICREARVLAVADAFVDLATPKAHRPSESVALAMERLGSQAGSQFDPSYVEALKRVLSRESKTESEQRDWKFRKFHCRHYLALGHFYTQIHETEWALRSYRAALRMATEMNDLGLEIGAISGRFMVFCDLGQLERAREVLQDVRARGTSQRGRLGYQLLWGLWEWLNGNRLGKEILDRLLDEYEKDGNIPGVAAALDFQACMTLFHQGSGDAEHLEYLSRFMKFVDNYDVFDVIERYRPYTIPVFLSAITQNVEPHLARNLLTRMGEPCHDAVLDKLSTVSPREWTKVLMPVSTLGTDDETVRSASSKGQARLYVKCLGELQILCGERTVSVSDWPTIKMSKLFAKLAIHQGRPLSVDVLIEEFWPDAGPKKGRDNLRNSLHKVRSTLKGLLDEPESQVVERSRKNGTLVLTIPCHFDYQEFETLVSEASRLVREQHPLQARPVIEKALELYHGEFLEGFDEEEWVRGIRAKLQGLYHQAVIILARSYLAEGWLAQAEEKLRELLQEDDLREEAHALLIEVVARSGRSVEAVELYENAVDLFQNEIGMAPDTLREPLEELGLLL